MNPSVSIHDTKGNGPEWIIPERALNLVNSLCHRQYEQGRG
jgi:hypothetical protein